MQTETDPCKVLLALAHKWHRKCKLMNRKLASRNIYHTCPLRSTVTVSQTQTVRDAQHLTGRAHQLTPQRLPPTSKPVESNNSNTAGYPLPSCDPVILSHFSMETIEAHSCHIDNLRLAP